MGLTYQPAVDGLRAVAVVPVVLYHADMPGFSGGFVGVDVFFVISGYLITGLLVRELEQTGRISFGSFFARRIRRLAPAFVLVILTTLVLGLVYLSPIGGEQQGLARSAIAAVGLSANLYFMAFTGGYFDAPAVVQPLLHLWSLSVAEQFYLVWPLLLSVLFLWGKRGHGSGRWGIAVGTSLIGVLSLAACILLSRHNAHVAFYLTPTRAWEFAGGALVFLLTDRVWQSRGRLGEALAVAGLTLIAASVVTFDSELDYPGVWALIPVLGTMGVLAGVQGNPGSMAGLFLRLKPLVGVGLWSYAWYLWHWPLLTLARVDSLGMLALGDALLICAGSLLLAWLTYRLVEQPIRSGRLALLRDTRQTLRIGGVGLVLTAVLALGTGLWAKFLWPMDAANADLSRAMSEMRKVRVACGQPTPYSGRLKQSADCDRPEGQADPAPRILVWGDSHAAHLVPMLEAFAGTADAAFRIRYMPQCPPMLGFTPETIGIRGAEGCADFNRDVLDEITQLRRSGRLEAVVMNGRWTGYGGTEAGSEMLARQLPETLAELKRLGVRTVLWAPGPDLPHDALACLLRRDAHECGIDRRAAERSREPVLSVLTSAAASTGAAMVDPFAALCLTDFCPAIRDATVLFTDSHHLSVAGSRSLLPVAMPVLLWALATSSEDR